MRDLWITRIIFVSIFVLMSFHLKPFGLETLPSILLGAVSGTAIILFESRLRRVSLGRLLGAAVGSVLGIAGAFLMSLVVKSSLPPEAASFISLGVLLLFGYVGMAVGGAKGETLNLAALGGVFGEDKARERSQKLLDTSVIIDGRIADVAAAGFMDGVLVVPQFVLWELQLVADSADSLKRNRGRRGLDILQKIQKMSGLNVRILETDYPRLKEVDLKLIQLAKDIDAKIVTNDFNLNKLAQPARRTGAEHQRTGKHPQACRFAGREHARIRLERGQGAQPGGGLSRRRNDGGSRQCSPVHQSNDRSFRYQRSADDGGQNDLRPLRRENTALERIAPGTSARVSRAAGRRRALRFPPPPPG